MASKRLSKRREQGQAGPDELAMTQSVHPTALFGGSPGGSPQRHYLLVFDGQSCYSCDLPASGAVVIGRAPECDLLIEAPSASRQHARIDVSSDAVWVCDLESRNGTRLNGELIAGTRQLFSGDVISICTATLLFHRSTETALQRSPLPLSYLRQRLREEISRARHYQRPVSVLRLCYTSSAARQTIADTVGSQLRTLDILAWSEPSGLQVLCPELSRQEVAEVAAQLSEVLRPLCEQLQVGMATCPEDGTDGDMLLACCQAAAQAASASGEPRSAGDLVSAVEIGRQHILLAEPAMKRLYSLIEKLAPSELSVLIQGETGTGKELAAAALHHGSKRRGPLLAVNCAALTESLAESELFGHERGAFTGAVAAKPGLFEAADGGTLFLDEIGELSLSIQAKLLRVLETQKVTRVGDTRERPIDVRVVAATNRDLADEAEAGGFRLDLYFRLSTARLFIPPLRDRLRELPLLARALLRDACSRRERPQMEIASSTLHRLLSYRWPGNIRELRNLMEYAAATVDEQVLMPWHVAEQLKDHEQQAAGALVAPRSPAVKFCPLDEEVRTLERRRIVEALGASDGVHVRAAALIGMPIRTFTAKVKQYRLGSSRGGEAA